jgi:hypothetical protein
MPLKEGCVVFAYSHARFGFHSVTFCPVAWFQHFVMASSTRVWSYDLVSMTLSILVAVVLASVVMTHVQPLDGRVDLIKRDVAQGAIDNLHASFVRVCSESLWHNVALNNALESLQSLPNRVEWTHVVDASPAMDVDVIQHAHEMWSYKEMKPVLLGDSKCHQAIYRTRILSYPRIFDNLTVSPRPNDAYRVLFRAGGLVAALFYGALGIVFFALGMWFTKQCRPTYSATQTLASR